jgi:hypothetical protein
VIINDCLIAVGGENHTNVGCAAASQHETDYCLFFPGRRLRAPFTKSCDEMRPPYLLVE